MKYLFIFVLILFACSDEPVKKCTPFEVIISDALPIQFWQADCDTYNEKEVCGVHRKCWCQPWECDDEIVLQLTDTLDNDYIISVLSENGEELFNSEFTKTVPLSLSILSDGSNNGSGTSWTIDTSPSVTMTYAGVPLLSKVLWLEVFGAIANTDYEFEYNIGSTGGSGQIHLYLLDSLGANLDEVDLSLGDESGTVTFNSSSSDIRYIGIEILLVSGTTTTTINQFDLVTEGDGVYKYNLSFIPSETSPEICNERVRIEIINTSVSPDEVVAKSDCLDIRQNHACTNVIEYSNNLNLDGLIYEDVSPITTFKIRVPSVFFHEKFVEEDNVIKLTSSIVKTNSSLEAQRLFETDYMPYYMHRKLQLIFKHQSLFIDEQYWVKQEAYEIQDGERRWPVKKAKCFLNETDYVRAVL